AILMAIGQFLLVFEQIGVFYLALGFLIIGNGFFKPNMSTQVGRLYPQNDPRRDGAYTIFYMGINLGAFLAPLICGWLQENTVGGYHTGFTMAGIGMIFGLCVYLAGLRWVLELPQGKVEAKAASAESAPAKDAEPISESEAERTPSAVPLLNVLSPRLLFLVGVLCLGGAVAYVTVQHFYQNVPWRG